MHAALVLLDSGHFIVAITLEHQHYNGPGVYITVDSVVNLYSPRLNQMTANYYCQNITQVNHVQFFTFGGNNQNCKKCYSLCLLNP